MDGPYTKDPGELEPAAVTHVLLHALTVRRPRPRYSVTWITKVFMFLKRILPVSFLDRLVMRAMGLAPYKKLHP